ncbi:MAG: pyruvate dehydrogenase complex dihydrolipoamide acetyltransferase [Defluviicoccus sp.]
MPIEVLMPALSPTMTEGKLARWLKREGETVNSGDVIAEIETDKATMEVEAVDEGILGKILVAEGSEHVAVNAPIAVILVEGEDASALTAAGSPAPAKVPAQTPAAPAAAPAVSAAAVTAPAAPAAGARIFASPLAKRMAADAGLDLAAIKGSGPHGRIIKADIEAAKQAPRPGMPAPAPAAAKPAPAGAAVPAAPQPFETPYVEVANSTMRKVIARRLSDSKRDIPHYYLTIECNIDPLLELRDKLNARAGEGATAFKLSVNDFVIRAVALALRAYPDANCSWTDEAIRYYQTVDVAVAVAAPNGLITPIVRNADAKGLAAISNEIKYLAGRARESKLMPEEYAGGGFTVSNLGMYGIKEFAAIINPPQSCLLAVGAAEKRPIVKDGALAVATMMNCTLSADHRSVDGAKGAGFLKVFKGLIEDPLTMLL